MEDQKIKNAKDALKYVQDQGWKIKKSAFYKHIKDGKLHPDAEGFQVKAVDRYAKTFLTRTDGAGKVKNQKIISLSERKLRAETLKMESQARHWDLKARAAAGEFMNREDVQIEVATKGLIFKSNLQNFILTQTPELIRLCGGDQNKIDELRVYFQDAAEIWFNELMKPINWTVELNNDPKNPEMLIVTVTPGEIMENDNEDEE